MLDVITCISEGDDPCGRRRQGVSRPDDGPAGRREGASLVPRLASPPAGCDREARVRAHDSTGEPGAGNRHAGFGERGEETCPRNSDCGPARKRRMSHRLPTGYAPPLDSTHGEALVSAALGFDGRCVRRVAACSGLCLSLRLFNGTASG